MSCNNCGKNSDLDGIETVCIIKSAWNPKDKDKEKESSADFKSVSISEALSVIFEALPSSLSLKSTPTAPLQNSIFSCRFDFCQNCAENLTLLYNSYQQFILLTNLEQKVCKKIQELDILRKTSNNEYGNQVSSKRGSTLTLKKKGTSGGPSKIRKVEEKNYKDVAPISEMGKNSFLNIKTEIVSDQEFELEEDGFENEFFFKGQDGGRGSNSNSPVNSHDHEKETTQTTSSAKSLRPLRKSSARNKSLKDGFKQEFDEDESDEVESILNNVQVELGDGQQDQEESNMDESNSAWEDTNDEDEDSHPKKKNRKRSTSKKSTKSADQPNKRKKSNPDASEKRFECAECGKILSNKKSLNRHIQIHTKSANGSVSKIPKREYECPICPNLKFSQLDIEQHVSTVHSEISCPWKCTSTVPACKLTFATLSELIKHRYKNNHYTRKQVNCPVCGKQTRPGYQMNRHLVSVHLVRSDKPIPENSSSEDEVEVSTPFRGEEGGSGHGPGPSHIHMIYNQSNINQFPSKSKKKYKCRECGKRFDSQNKLSHHLVSHGIGENEIFKCEICSREFKHLSSKETHMQRHAEDNPFKCNQENCGKSFSRRDHLIRHFKNIHKICPSEKDLPSLQPNRQRQERSSLDKEVQCHLCGKLIKRERLNLHLASHSGEKSHACDFCGKTFALRSSLLAHLKSHTGVPAGTKSYICFTCGQSFKCSDELAEHKLIHSDPRLRPYICSVCGKGFARSSNLRQHMETHSNEVHKCHICGKVYSWMNKLKSHLKEKHGLLSISRNNTNYQSSETSESNQQNPYEPQETQNINTNPAATVSGLAALIWNNEFY